MARSATYEVGVTYCNGRSFKSDHDKLHEAMKEYTMFLANAVEPALVHDYKPDAKHIRMVTFIGFDEAGEVTHHIDSGVFECADTQSVA